MKVGVKPRGLVTVLELLKAFLLLNNIHFLHMSEVQ